jgi:hypothetical protein
MGRAIDIVSPNVGRTLDALRAAFGSSIKELYYTPRGFIRNGAPTTDLAATTRAQHRSHVHLALVSGGRFPGTPPANPMADNLLRIDEYGMPRVRVRSREWVIQEPSADRYGDQIMSAINDKRIPKDVLRRFAVGGRVPGACLSCRPALPEDRSISKECA